MQPDAWLPVVVLGPYLTVAVLERFPALRFKPSSFLRGFFGTDLIWFAITLGIPLLARPHIGDLALPAGAAFWEGLPLPVSAGLALITYDGVTFGVHVLLHRFDALWKIHKVHHSSITLDWLATSRQHALEGLLRNVPAQAVLFLVGFPLEAIVIALGGYVGSAVLGHGNLRLNLRWLEPLFITPRLHRCHHVPATVDRNFATVFSFWDRLAGSLVVRDTETSEPLGVPGELRSYPQPFHRALLEPFRRNLGATPRREPNERSVGGR